MSLPTLNKSSLLGLVLLLCLLFLGYFSAYTSFAPDSYLHLGIGRYVLVKRAIPTHSDISYKTAQPSLEWISHSWLFDVLAFLSVSPNESLGPLILLLPFALCVLVLLLSIWNESKVPPHIQALLLPLGTILMYSFWKVHPLVIVGPLLLAIWKLFQHWHSGKTQFLFLFPVIGILWANMAGGYILIAALFTSWLIVWEIFSSWILPELINTKIVKSRGEWKTVLVSILITIIATLLNPSGLQLYIYGITGYALLGSAKWYSTLAGALEVTNTSIFKTNLSPAYYVVFLVYAFSLILLVSGLLFRHKSTFVRSAHSYLPLLPMIWFGFYFVRFIPLATIVTLPLFGVSLSFVTSRKHRQLPTIFQNNYIVLAFILAVFCVWTARRPTEIHFEKPVEQCSIIRQNRLPPNILVSTEIVGYMYWCLFPQKQQIDARDDFFDSNDTIGVYGQMTTITDENIRNLIDENSINIVLTNKENEYITSYFSQKPEWSLIYLDYNGVLLVRNTVTRPEFISDYALRYINLSRNLGFDPEKITEATDELQDFTDRYPRNRLANGQLASLYRFSSQLTKAEIVLNKIPKSQWDFTTYTEMGRIQAALGKCTESERNFLHALSVRGEQNVTKTVLDLAIVYAGCMHDQEKAKYYLQRYVSYPLPEFERQRAVALAKKFQIVLDDD